MQSTTEKNKQKLPDFPRDEFYAKYEEYKWHIMNFALNEIVKANLPKNRIYNVMRALEKLETEITMIVEEHSLEKSLQGIQIDGVK